MGPKGRARAQKMRRNVNEGQGFLNRVQFLEHAQSHSGGYYKVYGTQTVVEFIRPCNDSASNYFMRVRDLRTDRKTNFDFLDLIPANEMEVIALQLIDPDDTDPPRTKSS